MHMFLVILYIAVLVVNYGISNHYVGDTIVYH